MILSLLVLFEAADEAKYHYVERLLQQDSILLRSSDRGICPGTCTTGSYWRAATSIMNIRPSHRVPSREQAATLCDQWRLLHLCMAAPAAGPRLLMDVALSRPGAAHSASDLNKAASIMAKQAGW